MNNTTLEKISFFKNSLENLKIQKPLIDKATISKLLVMANIAEMVIYGNGKVPIHERYYFEGQAFVGRYLSDWGVSNIATDYFVICNYIKENHW